MDLGDQIERLKREMEALARMPDDEVLRRYAMQKPRRPPGLYWQLRWLAGRTVRWLQSKGVLPSDPWPVRLKHAEGGRNSKPLLIWAVGANPRTLRSACETLSCLLESMPEFAPVLVTDIADFAFFSRLGWLVEYLPAIEGEGDPFQARKARHLARLYRAMPVVPVGAGLEPEVTAQTVRRLIIQAA
jgi:hypothetical protein